MTKETYSSPIAVLKKAVGNASAALLLERVVFWNTRPKGGVMYQGRLWVAMGEYKFAGRWHSGELTVWRGGPGEAWSHLNLGAPNATLARAMSVFDAIYSWGIVATGAEWIET